jgi:[ribosomal protein S5]-alanine N-acetyltransferase
MLVSMRSARFEIRSLSPDEGIETQLRWLSDPAVVRFTNARYRQHDSASVRAYVASHDNELSFLLGVFDRAGGTHVGNHRIERDQRHGTCSLGALIGDRRYWGRGVLTETRAAVLDVVFAELGAHRAWAQVASRNIAVLGSYRRLGFRCEGILREHLFIEDRRMDVVQFGMICDEWFERRGLR